MEKYNRIASLIICTLFLFMMPLTALANSSWYWISSTRPYDVLPFVIVITLAIEILAIHFIAKAKKIGKTICYVTFGNLVSFLAPYVFLYCQTVDEDIYTFSEVFEHTPGYIVGVVYLIMTIAIELPIVYFALKEDVEDRKKLLWCCIGANVVTTVITAVAERLICVGQW